MTVFSVSLIGLLASTAEVAMGFVSNRIIQPPQWRLGRIVGACTDPTLT